MHLFDTRQCTHKKKHGMNNSTNITTGGVTVMLCTQTANTLYSHDKMNASSFFAYITEVYFCST